LISQLIQLSSDRQELIAERIADDFLRCYPSGFATAGTQPIVDVENELIDHQVCFGYRFAHSMQVHGCK
jgi:hypothetical protein